MLFTKVIPIIFLCSLTIDRIIARELRSPIAATLRIMTKCRKTSIEIPLAKCKRVPLRSLDRPFTDEDGEFPTAGFLLRVGAELGQEIGGGGVGRMLVVVDMHVKDEIGISR